MHLLVRRPRLSAALTAATALCIALPGLAAQITDVRVGVHPKFTRIVFELDGRAGYQVERGGTDAAPELRITIEAMSSARELRSNGDVRGVKVDAGTKARAHIALRQSGLRVHEMMLADPPRIVIDLHKPETAVAETAKPAPKTRVAAKEAPAPAPAPKVAAKEAPAPPAPAPAPKVAGKETPKPELAPKEVAKETPKPAPQVIAKETPKPAPPPQVAPTPRPAPEAPKTAVAPPAPPPAPKEVAPVPSAPPAGSALNPAPRVTPPPSETAQAAKPAVPPVPEAAKTAAAPPAPLPAPALTTPPAAVPPAPVAPTSDSVAKLPSAPVPTPPPAAQSPSPVRPTPTPAPTSPAAAPTASESWSARLTLWIGGIAAALLSLAAIVVVQRRRRALPNDLDVTAIAEEVEQTSDAPGRIPSGGFAMGDDSPSPSEESTLSGLFERPAAPAPVWPAPPPSAKPTTTPTPTAAAEDSLFEDAGEMTGEPDAREGDAPMNQEMDLPVDRRTSPPAPRMGGSAAPSPDIARMLQDFERRIATLEARLDESNEAREKLERQVAAQSEELRVQRAAIARTQRALRTMTRSDEEKATEPALRDGDTQAKTRVTP